LLAELTDILARPKFGKKISAALLSVDPIVGLYAELAASVRPTAIPRIASDPDDDVVIGTALAAKADYLVTGDRALLSLAEYEGGRIVSVSEALALTADFFSSKLPPAPPR
jgi:putative PIN family toxin of toxin-antitoxin system